MLSFDDSFFIHLYLAYEEVLAGSYVSPQLLLDYLVLHFLNLNLFYLWVIIILKYDFILKFL